jgi:hydroxyethylthiazole kinase-like uncharacterized protein yjeF
MKSIPAHPVLSCEESREWEHLLLKSTAAEWAAMQRAGDAVATAILDDSQEIGGLPQEARLLVLVGKGHNGGDALLAAQKILREHPKAKADVLFFFQEALLKPLAKRSWRALQKGGGKARVRRVSESDAMAATYAVCLDGVFGFQFRPPLDAATATRIAQLNAHPSIRLRAAIDLPSGLGVQKTDKVFRADFTYATGIVKAPVLDSANEEFVGRCRYLDLGFFAQDAKRSAAAILMPSVLSPLTRLRSPKTDKRTFGHVFVLGGSLSYPGAVMLAVRAALRSGVGLVTAFVPAMLVPHYAAAHPEVMWVGCPVGRSGGLNAKTLPLIRSRLSRAKALLIGPGMGAAPETIRLVETLAEESPVPVVLDADALRPEVIARLKEKPFICTPHAGEYARIAEELKRHSSGVVVMKGPRTHIRSLSARVSSQRSEGNEPTLYHSLVGGPVLARGGSGDILAGLAGGLLAQTPSEPLLAACRAVMWHGLAADLLARARGQVAVETSQLLEQLGPALASIACPNH